MFRLRGALAAVVLSLWKQRAFADHGKTHGAAWRNLVMKAVFAPIEGKPWRRLLVMVPMTIVALSGPLPAGAESERASQLQHGLASSEQMAARDTSSNTKMQPSPGRDEPVLAPSRQIKCDRNETIVGGRCVAKRAEKPHKPAHRARERDESHVRTARVTDERPAKSSRLCWTQDGRAFSVTTCN